MSAATDERPIRVLRILEYTYRDIEAMEHDQANWYVGLNGTRRHRLVTIRSATLPAQVEFRDEPIPSEQEPLSPSENYDVDGGGEGY